jgi:hypothetical protein
MVAKITAVLTPPPADEQMQECAADLLAKVVAATGAARPGWCQECALPRLLRLAMHRDYSIRIVRKGVG